MLGLRFPEISDNFFHECYVVRDSALLKIFLNFGLVFVYFSSNKFYSYMYSFKCMSFVSFQAFVLACSVWNNFLPFCVSTGYFLISLLCPFLFGERL